MHARRTLYRTNGSVIARPFVLMAARVLGPGPLRLKMVKLAHDLSDGGVVLEASRRSHETALPLERPAAHTQRAA
ncbi:MAG TPA: hypothetical protein VGG90_05060 [Candidatus Dormibacteraeota bacterium]|jgi:hypothetical protein